MTTELALIKMVETRAGARRRQEAAVAHRGDGPTTSEEVQEATLGREEPGPPLLSSTRCDEVWCGDEESQLGDTVESNHEGQHLTAWIGHGDRTGECGLTWAWDKEDSEHQDEHVGGVARRTVCSKTAQKNVTKFKCFMCNEEKSGFLNYRNHLITHFNLDPLIDGNKCATCHKVCRDRADAKRHVALTHK